MALLGTNGTEKETRALRGSFSVREVITALDKSPLYNNHKVQNVFIYVIVKLFPLSDFDAKLVQNRCKYAKVQIFAIAQVCEDRFC